MKLKYDDETHRYWLDGIPCKGASGVAKIPDDLYNLQQWEKRMVAVGIAKSPPLVERVAAHYNDKKILNKICDEAKTIAEAYVASGRGTAAHRITERHDLDQLVIDTALSTAVRKLWNETLDQAGLDVVPEYIERIVVFPDQRICGRFDRYCRRRSDGRLVVVDLKTGENAIKYPHAIACQMAMYANAPLMAGPLPSEGGTTTVFEPLPGYDPGDPAGELDREVGVVIHMPAEDKAEAVEINIADGWDMVRNHIFPILDWRKRQDLVQRTQLIPTVALSAVGTDEAGPPSPPLQVVPAPSTSSEGAVEQKSGPSTAPAPSTLAGAQPGVSPPQQADQARLDWLKMRIKAIHDEGHMDFLRSVWPIGVIQPFNDDDINAIADACSAVEDMFQMQWQPTDPLFASFAQAKEDPVIRPENVVPLGGGLVRAAAIAAMADGSAYTGGKNSRDEAREWANRGKQLLADLDDLALARAIIAVCRIEKGTPMTAELYQRLEAVTNQLQHPEGAIYQVADGPDSWQILASVEHAKPQMIDVAGNQVEAWRRAGRLAKQIGLVVPHNLRQAADQPLLAALVAEGHGQGPTT